MIPGGTPESSLVETPSGLLIPAGVADAVQTAQPADEPGQPAAQNPDDGIFLDPDGRRRIVLTRDDRRTLNRAIRTLQKAGLGIVVGCRGPCGQPLRAEGRPAKPGDVGDLDQGYGCECSRVHFR